VPRGAALQPLSLWPIAASPSLPPCSEAEAQEGSGEEGGEEAVEGSDGGGAIEPAHALGRRQQQQQQHKQVQRHGQQQQQQQQGRGAEPEQPHKKMSKHALRVMAKTKMKLEGKKGRGTQAGFAKHLASKKKFKSKKK
jgi:hypothetical protein